MASEDGKEIDERFALLTDYLERLTYEEFTLFTDLAERMSDSEFDGVDLLVALDVVRGKKKKNLS